MSYECSCDYDDYDHPDFVTTRTVKASRKSWRCDECGEDIRVGESYEYVSGKWVGDIHYYRTCRHCVSLREWAMISVPCFCYAYTGLLEEIKEMVQQVRHDVPGFFFEYGRRIVAIKRARVSP